MTEQLTLGGGPKTALRAGQFLQRRAGFDVTDFWSRIVVLGADELGIVGYVPWTMPDYFARKEPTDVSPRFRSTATLLEEYVPILEAT